MLQYLLVEMWMSHTFLSHINKGDMTRLLWTSQLSSVIPQLPSETQEASQAYLLNSASQANGTHTVEESDLLYPPSSASTSSEMSVSVWHTPPAQSPSNARPADDRVNALG